MKQSSSPVWPGCLSSIFQPGAVLLVCAVLLSGLGLATQLSTPPSPHPLNYRGLWQDFRTPMLNLIAGGLIGLGFARWNCHRFLLKQAKWMLAGWALAMIYTSLFGLQVQGCRQYLWLGSFTLMPIALSSLIVPIAVVKLAEDDQLSPTEKADRLPWLGAGLILFLSVMGILQCWRPFLFLVVFCVIGLFLAGERWKGPAAWLLLPIGLILLKDVAAGWGFNGIPRSSHYLVRFFHGNSYQLEQAGICFEQSGWWGRGFGLPMISLPEWRHDYVFAALAWEGGKAACLMAMALFCVLAWTGACCVAGTSNRSLRLLKVILLVNLVFTALAAMAANLHLGPLLGERMPFLSFGREQMLIAWATVGILWCKTPDGEAEEPVFAHARTRLFLGAILVGFVGIAVALPVRAQPRPKSMLPPPASRSVLRGAIVDARSAVLATNTPVWDLLIQPHQLLERNNPPWRESGAAARQLGPMLEMPEQQILERFQVGLERANPLTEVPLLKDILPGQVARLRQALQPFLGRGMRLQLRWKRFYPMGRAAAHLLGEVAIDGTGVSGIERAANPALVTPENADSPQGKTVKLTLDGAMQSITDEELDNAARKCDPMWAYAVIAQPQTGAILAWSQYPWIDPNRRTEAGRPEWSSRIASTGFEPGGLIKPIVTALALEAKTVQWDTSINVGNGLWTNANGVKIRDHHPFGMITVRDGLRQSSHTVAAWLGTSLGAGQLYDGLRRFGLGQRTGIEVNAETAGMLHAPSNHWSASTLTQMSMGYEVFTSPLQVLQMYCALAAGGQMARLHVLSPDRIETPANPGNRRVLSAETAAQITEVLKEVVSPAAIGASAALQGIPLAGMPATSQKAGPNGYESGKFVVAFCGYTSQVVVLVLLDEPRLDQFSPKDNPAGLVIQAILERAAPFLKGSEVEGTKGGLKRDAQLSR